MINFEIEKCRNEMQSSLSRLIRRTILFTYCGTLNAAMTTSSLNIDLTCGQSYKASTIVIYDSRVVPDLKIPHITTLES